MKRFYCLVLIFNIFFFSFFTSFLNVNAEGWDTPGWSNIEFGDGYNNMASSDGKFAAVMSAILSASGVKVDFAPSASGQASAKQFYNAFLQKSYDYKQNFYDFVVNNCDINWDNSRGTIHFSQDFVDFINGTSSSDLPFGSLADFYTYLFGDNALSGNPFSTSIQTPYTITLDGNEVLPWKLNKNINTIYDGRLNPNMIISRGEYILPSDRNYYNFWSDIYNNNASHNKTFSWSFLDVNNNTRVVTARNPYVARSVVNATFGDVCDIYFKSGTTNLYLFWNMYNSGQVALNSWLPCITSDGYFVMLNYSYIYSGTFEAQSWGGNSYLLFLVAAQNSSHAKPLTSSPSDIIFSHDGTTQPQVNYFVDNSLTVYGDNYNDVINNFYNNEPVATSPYKDPFTDWDTSGGGTLTPDGGGGFNLDLGNFHLPDLNINWSISGFKDKFPFCIPWDIIRFFDILNTSPEAPHIEATIDLHIVSWDLDIDFSEYDAVASLFRNVIYISFVIGLIFYTKDFLKR